MLLLIEASTEKLERDITRGLLAASWQQAMYSFPRYGDKIEIMMGMCTGVRSISYVNTDGVTTVLDPSEWTFSQARACVFSANPTWPHVNVDTVSDKVFINFTCGTSDPTCLPRLFKQAILLETGRAYFDPAQEAGVNTNDGRSYEALVQKLLRSTYP